MRAETDFGSEEKRQRQNEMGGDNRDVIGGSRTGKPEEAAAFFALCSGETKGTL